MRLILQNQNILATLAFWAWIPVILFSKAGANSALDIAIHDTYIVIDAWYWKPMLVVPLLLFGLGYWHLKRRKLNGYLTIAHVSLTYIGVGMAYALAYMMSGVYRPRYYYEYVQNEGFDIVAMVALIAFCFILGSVSYLINLKRVARREG